MLPLLAAVIIYISMCYQAGGKYLLPYLSMACGYFGRLKVVTDGFVDLFDEVNELYLLAHQKSSGSPYRNSLLDLGDTSAFTGQDESLDEYSTLLAEFDPK